MDSIPPVLRSGFIAAALFFTVTDAPPASADGIQAWCGNSCSSQDDGGTACDWTPASSGQTCQAKAICSTDECTVWAVENNKSVVGFSVTQTQAKRLRGAITYKAKRPHRAP